MMPINRICVFCGSSTGVKPSYAAAATELGQQLAARNIELVYGGGTVGLMGSVAHCCFQAGEKVVGVIPEALNDTALSGQMIVELFVTKDMHERKAKMSELATMAFVALPGGLGTMEELFEVLTWAQLGFHQKPVAVLNIEGYFDGLVSFLKHSVDQGFIRECHASNLIVAKDLDELFSTIESWRPVTSLIESIKSSASMWVSDKEAGV